MNWFSGIFAHIVFLLSMRHKGENLPQNWGPSVYIIVFIAIIFSQFNLMVISNKLNENQTQSTSISNPGTSDSTNNDANIGGAKVEIPPTDSQGKSYGTNSDSTVPANNQKQIAPNHLGSLITQILSFAFISVVGGIPLMCAFALIAIGIDSLKIIFTILQFPVIFIYLWEMAAVVAITWRMIKHKFHTK